MLTRRTLLLGVAASAVLASMATPVLFSTAAFAISPQPAVAFVNQMGVDLVAVVNSNGSDATKQAGLAGVIDRTVDVGAVARFVLGRYWRTATPAQQKDFAEVFHRVIVVSIGGHLGDYRGVSFTIDHTQPAASEGGIAVRTTLTRPANPPARVDWLVSDASGSPKVVDVLAEGTSLRLTQRSDYGSFLEHNGNNVQALIDALRRQVSG